MIFELNNYNVRTDFQTNVFKSSFDVINLLLINIIYRQVLDFLQASSTIIFIKTEKSEQNSIFFYI